MDSKINTTIYLDSIFDISGDVDVYLLPFDLISYPNPQMYNFSNLKAILDIKNKNNPKVAARLNRFYEKVLKSQKQNKRKNYNNIVVNEDKKTSSLLSNPNYYNISKLTQNEIKTAQQERNQTLEEKQIQNQNKSFAKLNESLTKHLNNDEFVEALNSFSPGTRDAPSDVPDAELSTLRNERLLKYEEKEEPTFPIVTERVPIFRQETKRDISQEQLFVQKKSEKIMKLEVEERKRKEQEARAKNHLKQLALGKKTREKLEKEARLKKKKQEEEEASRKLQLLRKKEEDNAKRLRKRKSTESEYDSDPEALTEEEERQLKKIEDDEEENLEEDLELLEKYEEEQEKLRLKESKESKPGLAVQFLKAVQNGGANESDSEEDDQTKPGQKKPQSNLEASEEELRYLVNLEKEAEKREVIDLTSDTNQEILESARADFKINQKFKNKLVPLCEAELEKAETRSKNDKNVREKFGLIDDMEKENYLLGLSNYNEGINEFSTSVVKYVKDNDKCVDFINSKEKNPDEFIKIVQNLTNDRQKLSVSGDKLLKSGKKLDKEYKRLKSLERTAREAEKAKQLPSDEGKKGEADEEKARMKKANKLAAAKEAEEARKLAVQKAQDAEEAKKAQAIKDAEKLAAKKKAEKLLIATEREFDVNEAYRNKIKTSNVEQNVSEKIVQVEQLNYEINEYKYVEVSEKKKYFKLSTEFKELSGQFFKELKEFDSTFENFTILRDKLKITSASDDYESINGLNFERELLSKKLDTIKTSITDRIEKINKSSFPQVNVMSAYLKNLEDESKKNAQKIAEKQQAAAKKAETLEKKANEKAEAERKTSSAWGNKNIFDAQLNIPKDKRFKPTLPKDENVIFEIYSDNEDPVQHAYTPEELGHKQSEPKPTSESKTKKEEPKTTSESKPKTTSESKPKTTSESKEPLIQKDIFDQLEENEDILGNDRWFSRIKTIKVKKENGEKIVNADINISPEFIEAIYSTLAKRSDFEKNQEEKEAAILSYFNKDFVSESIQEGTEDYGLPPVPSQDDTFWTSFTENQELMDKNNGQVGKLLRKIKEIRASGRQINANEITNNQVQINSIYAAIKERSDFGNEPKFRKATNTQNRKYNFTERKKAIIEYFNKH